MIDTDRQPLTGLNTKSVTGRAHPDGILDVIDRKKLANDRAGFQWIGLDLPKPLSVPMSASGEFDLYGVPGDSSYAVEAATLAQDSFLRRMASICVPQRC